MAAYYKYKSHKNRTYEHRTCYMMYKPYFLSQNVLFLQCERSTSEAHVAQGMCVLTIALNASTASVFAFPVTISSRISVVSDEVYGCISF